MISRIYQDDKTSRYSDTTLRTWLLFILFLLFALTLAITCILSMFGIIAPVEIYLKFALDLLWLIGVMALGGGGLYLGKRINDGRFPGASQIISPPGNTVSGDTGAAAPDPIQPVHQRTGGYRGIP